MAYTGVPRILERVDLQVERKTLWKKKEKKRKNIYLVLQLRFGSPMREGDCARVKTRTRKTYVKSPAAKAAPNTALSVGRLRAHNFSRAREITVMGTG